MLNRVSLRAQPRLGCLLEQCLMWKKMYKICMDQCMNFVDLIDCYFSIYEADILNAAPGNNKSIITHSYTVILMYSLPCSCKDKSSHFA